MAEIQNLAQAGDGKAGHLRFDYGRVLPACVFRD